MRIIQEKCVEYDPERKLSIIVEYIAGKVTQTIDRLIALYRPDSLVVGTRGKRGIMGVGFGGMIGSISKYVLSPPFLCLVPDKISQILSFALPRSRYRSASGTQTSQSCREAKSRPEAGNSF